MIRWRHMQYLIRLSDLLQAFQDQENIIVPLMCEEVTDSSFSFDSATSSYIRVLL